VSLGHRRVRGYYTRKQGFVKIFAACLPHALQRQGIGF